MKTKFPRLFSALIVLVPVLLPAQSKSIPSERSNERATGAQVMSAALTLRANTAARVANGELTPAEAVARLRRADTPSGLPIEPEAGLGLAVIDIAQRLLMQGKPVLAEELFREAEQILAGVVRNTPGSAARDKALYLRALAEIRGNYLNKLAEARADIEAALTLQPDDARLQKARDRIATRSAQLFPQQPRG